MHNMKGCDGKLLPFDDTRPLTDYDSLFESFEKSALPYVSRNDLDLIFDYFLLHKVDGLKLKLAWDRATAKGQPELFLTSLCRVVGRQGSPLVITRTKEDGTKLCTRLEDGFVSLVFDMRV